jgi:predicted NBD/HSP70 family sugar kinase
LHMTTLGGIAQTSDFPLIHTLLAYRRKLLGVPGEQVGSWGMYRTPRRSRCGCGNRGCLEALASGTAIARRTEKVANERPESAFERLAAERAPIGEDVLDLARKGDEVSVKVLQEAGIWLGIGLATFVNIFDPEVSAVGGGVSEAGDLVLEPARRELRLRSPRFRGIW